MIVILKSMAGCVFDINGVKKELRGGCYMNEITKSDFDYIAKNYKWFNEAIEKGFIVVSDTKEKVKENKAVDDTLQMALNKQNDDLAKNQKINKVEITKG